MTQSPRRLPADTVLPAIVVLAAVIFVTDLHTPLGIADGVLYQLPILLTVWMPQRSLPFRLAVIFTGLIILGAFYSPAGATADVWGSNRVMSVVGVWATAAFLVQRRRVEETWHEAHNELEARVHERTAALAVANATLQAEIVERRRAE